MKNFYEHQHGFSLLELSIVMAVMGILASSIIPIVIRSIQVRAGEKTALEIVMIQEACRNYYIDKASWPADIDAIKTQGYLNPNWNLINPWQNVSNPAYRITATHSILTINTDVPPEWTKLVISHLPGASLEANNTTVIAPIFAPGQAGLQKGIIVAWSGPIASIPKGWALCDGTNGTPDLRDRFVVGASQDNFGVAMTNVTASLTQSGNGQIPETTFIVPSSTNNGGGGHAGFLWNYNGFSYFHNDLTYTLGSGAVNIAVYYALAFIMKL